ncbi:MAG: hypothetical protein IPO17_17190 [Flavobacteriales bacterium]|nr:hypothetical protein [Flavobacteriales bacterium]
MFDLHSLINGNKARFHDSALTDCEPITLKATTLQRLYDEHKSFERLGRRLAEHQYLQAMDRILNSEAEAPERYKKLVAEHPDLVKVVAAKYLASYLGVTESTLSKIKREMVRPRPKVLS